jgi:hypothetical protein
LRAARENQAGDGADSACVRQRRPRSRAASGLCGAVLLGVLFSVPSASAHPTLMSSPLTDLALIEEISKFRSGAGHDFSYDASFPFGASDATEPASSMKHYLAPYSAWSGDQSTVPVYAPFAGEIVRVTEEGSGASANKRIEIESSTHSAYVLILFHIDLDEDYPQILNDWPIELWPSHQPDDSSYVTTTVAAGDLLGYADMRSAHDFDVAVLWTDTDGSRYWVSYFDLVPDSLFEAHEERGATRSDMTISKADRIATPVTWWGGRNDDDWVMLASAVPISPWMRGLLFVVVLLAGAQGRTLRARSRR